jgi:hypothetical protein
VKVITPPPQYLVIDSTMGFTSMDGFVMQIAFCTALLGEGDMSPLRNSNRSPGLAPPPGAVYRWRQA